MDCDRYREYGDLLFAYQSSLQRQPSVTLPSFEREEDITIPIDMRLISRAMPTAIIRNIISSAGLKVSCRNSRAV